MNKLHRFFSKERPFFRAEKPKSAENEILIYGSISSWLFWGDEVSAKDIIKQLDEKNDLDEITVRLNSPGGDVFESNCIYNALVRHHAKINIAIDGLAASGASIIAMSGDTIAMVDNGTMMIHDPWSIAIGNAEDFLKEAELLEKVALGMVNTYAARSGLDKAEVRDIMKTETWLTAEEAKEKGLVDSVILSKEKPKAKVDLSIFANVPDWVKEQYEMVEPPRKEVEMQLETAPVSLKHKQRKLQILQLG